MYNCIGYLLNYSSIYIYSTYLIFSFIMYYVPNYTYIYIYKYFIESKNHLIFNKILNQLIVKKTY